MYGGSVVDYFLSNTRTLGPNAGYRDSSRPYYINTPRPPLSAPRYHLWNKSNSLSFFILFKFFKVNIKYFF